ncbi:RNA-binding protein 34 [Seminavis robusta]|uniref:RNA-binding protein 34 n=1 Tax=Seminavis robusta TaxID=568900 RepID=A0A9N8H5R9_9STRA|nr:RNA-binding protein 34 [Seminavis robusta]|eukprot:Sro93_g048590.1 RNA-binding protein 34 (415) ;mRNA; r:81240-82484
MSLLQSIFGDAPAAEKSQKKGKKDRGLANLFDKFSKEGEKDPKKEVEDDDSSSSDDEDSSNGSSSNENKEKDIENEVDSSDNDDDENETENQEKAKKPTKRNTLSPAEKQAQEERTVFVGNLPLSTKRKSLIKLFSQVGKVESARLRSVAVTGVKLPPSHAGNQNLVKKVCTNTQQLDVEAKSSLQGYVRFADKDCVEQAIAKFNNTPLADTNPQATRAVRRIRVDTATPTEDPKRSVFVGNLPYQADEASLHEFFVQQCLLQMNDIVGVRIIRDKNTFQCKGIGYVLFQDATMVATALQRMQDAVYMRRNLRVNACANVKGQHHKKRTRHVATNNNTESSSNKKPRTVVASGAMKRVARKQNKRMRGEKKKNKNDPSSKPGVSKRAATEAKVDKRVKKLQKRITKGMGKARKS